ncbi:MAG: hypothetical protein ACYSUI_25925, partial [Planctomycetota bacterium]
QIMIDKELAMIHAIFGTDLDEVAVTKVDNKNGWKCQSAVAKAAGKCQDAKLATFNACKKDLLKAGDPTTGDLQDACMGAGAAPMPDGKGKIGKKCGNGLGGTLGKKCLGLDTDPLFPPCAGHPVSLAQCIDEKIECAVCRALNELDGLGRGCDLFDNGLGDESCGSFIDTRCELAPDPNTDVCTCLGGTNHGNRCFDPLLHSDCPPGQAILALCMCSSRAEMAVENFNPVFAFPLAGNTELECGIPDPDGVATCECRLQGPIALPIPSLTTACLTPREDACPPGLAQVIDCDGGTPMDVDVITDHNVDLCGIDDEDDLCSTDGHPECLGPFECEASCDAYCALQGPNYINYLSGCEGYCRGGVDDGQKCTFEQDCGLEDPPTAGFCVGGGLGASHRNQCTCTCLGVGGPASPPGGLLCYWSADRA